MELYKIIATCNNDSRDPHEFSFVPENFEGVKISQKFSWQNPIGYTPKFSLATMRAIGEDREYIDDVFNTYLMQSNITISVYKLKETADGYDFVADFSIDFDSYEMLADYSEFALKSISVLDDYNLIKDADIDVVNTDTAIIPDTKKYINYVSLARRYEEKVGDNEVTMYFRANEQSKIYNSDSALYKTTEEDDAAIKVYEFNRENAGMTTIAVAARGILSIFTETMTLDPTFTISIYKNTFENPVFEIYSGLGSADGRTDISISLEKTVMLNAVFADGDFYFVGIVSDNPEIVFEFLRGDFYLDLYVETEVNINKYNRYLGYASSESILNRLFNNNASIEESLKTVGVVSASQIVNQLSYMTLKPKDFINDFCIATGGMVNFKLDGSVDVVKSNTYFTALLNKSNAIELLDIKDVSFKYDNELNFIGLKAGMQPQTYEVYSYFADWQKILTWAQSNRYASEYLDLTLQKFRVDFSGIVDAIQKISTKKSDNQKDVFLFDPLFATRSSNIPYVHDKFTPRDIINNWISIIYAYFKDNINDEIEFISTGGSEDNIIVDGVNQMANIVLNSSAARILPVKVTFKGLVDEVDFSEKIIKINNNTPIALNFSEEKYIFVTEAVTTDNLNEQQITGNLIYFPE